VPLFEILASICLILTLVIDELRLRRVLKDYRDATKMLASRTYSEYAHGQAQIAKANHEQKPSDGYDHAWDSEETIHG